MFPSLKVMNGLKQSQLKKESELASLILLNHNWEKLFISNYQLLEKLSTVEILQWQSKVSKWLLIFTLQSLAKLLILTIKFQETLEQLMNQLIRPGSLKLSTILNHLAFWIKHNMKNWLNKATDHFTHLFLC